MAYSIGDKVKLDFPGVTYEAEILRPGDAPNSWWVLIDGQEVCFEEGRFSNG